jgi:hypothetical protein
VEDREELENYGLDDRLHVIIEMHTIASIATLSASSHCLPEDILIVTLANFERSIKDRKM